MTPPKRTRMTPEARRALILEAASAMFRDRGYAAASIDAIAEAAGISGPAIYRHFKSKPELLVALLERAVAGASGTIEAAMQAGGGVTVLADAMCAEARGEGAVIGLLQGHVHELSREDRARVDHVRADLLDRTTALLCAARPALAPADARVNLQAALAILAQQARLGSDAAGLARVVRAVLAA
ncbi:TetR/AcrR family transcriptional regulator [Sphingomonas jatrophae]|uniref:Transcriptional regulator, TetR family n=1 Tax=Sphingomonas jatrophae TaxID=1166337 RepID=A0A1I6M4X9_9SPHN|nr:helix-turn-helix domain-containing protein [Sphingomonas jatrophae]SFS10592.1 transcriptional regulator, TetR family [Sphingomonas jatrophae]